MKKLILKIFVLTLCAIMTTGLCACGETENNISSEAASIVSRVESAVSEAKSNVTSKLESNVNVVNNGTVSLANLVDVEVPSGWEGKQKENTITFEKEDWDSLSEVEVSVVKIYTEGDSAEQQAQKTQGNYNGKGKIDQETFGGIEYYHLSNVVDDDTQNIYFADIDKDHYLKVSLMYMPLSKGKEIFDKISIK